MPPVTGDPATLYTAGLNHLRSGRIPEALATLRGVLTDEEFAAKKKQVLGI